MELRELAPNVFVALGDNGGSHSGVIVGEDRVLVIDTGFMPAQAREIHDIAERHALGRATSVVNTHVHGDHVLGNERFPGATIIAHNAARDRLAKEAPEMLERFISYLPDREAELRKVRFVLPNLCYCRSLTLHLGTRRVELFHLGPAHTDGDTAVYLPDEGVLFTGDILFSGQIPALLPEASAQGWVRALVELEGMQVNTFVPGHGPVSTIAELRAERLYLEHVLEAVRAAIAKGMSRAEVIGAVPLGPAQGWEWPERHTRTVEHIYDELSPGR